MRIEQEKRNKPLKVAAMGLRGIPEIQGGVEKHCQSLYPRLNGVEVTLFRRKPYINHSADHTYKGIKYIDLPSTRVKGFEALFHTMLCAVQAVCRRPDVVHVHNIGPGLFIPFMKLFGLRVVMTYHSANYEHAKWGKMAKRLLRFAEKMSLRYADKVIFVNRDKYEACGAVIGDRAVYIPNGVERIEPTDDDSRIRRFGLERGKYILAVGRITPEKGFDCLVRGANMTGSDEKVVIVGGSDHDERYLQELKALDVKGRVCFTGSLTGEDLRQIYSNARLFVLSSINEGFPLVMLEAMNYRLPIMATDISATRIPQINDNDKFAPGDAEALARALETHACDRGPVDYDTDEYDWNHIADATCRILRQTAEK